MLNDLRFALRVLRRQRGYAAMAILTFALGVGANAAVFSVADSVLFRPLPFAGADRLFALHLSDPATGTVFGTLPAATVEAARATGAFDAIATATPMLWRAYIHTPEGLDALTLAPASRNYLDVLGVRVVAGRTFDASDAGTRAVVLTHETWMRRYGGDPAVVGTSVPIVQAPTEPASIAPIVRIVGVLPPRLRLPLAGECDGLVLDDEQASGGDQMFAPLVRLGAGLTAASASARLRAIRAAGDSPILRLVPVREELASQQDPVLWLLLGAAAIVLLAACVNLANLTLARGTARVRELAIRASLGGPRSKLIRLLLIESLCIATAGTAVGLMAGYWGTRSLSAALPPLLASAADPSFDTRAFLFTLAAAAVSTVLFGLVPALRLTRSDRVEDLRAVMQTAAATRRGAQLLVALEVAVCVALVAGAVLVGRTLFALTTQDVGFAPHRLAANYDLPTMMVVRDGKSRVDVESQSAFFRTRLNEARAVPGVRAAALASAVPLSGIAPDASLFDGRGEQAGGVYGVSSGYFAALGIPLLAGRDLTDEEAFGGAPVGVLNLAAAHRICGTPAACLGRSVQAPRQAARTVVGVVSDVRPSIRAAPIAAMYVPFLPRFSLKTIVMSADGRPGTTDRIRQALSVSSDARLRMRALDEQASREISPYRFNAIVIGGFAALTLALAIVGVYGVMATMVGQRTREYGVRLALGATRARVNRHVLSLAAVPIGAGIAAGIVVAAWAARFLGSLLYGVVPLDPVSFGAAAIVLALSGAAAALVPARRASRVDPVVALRAE
jgi:putative ABC transport system permease protein